MTEGRVTLNKEMMNQCPCDQLTVIQATFWINITHKIPSERWKCAHRTQATYLKRVLCDFVHPLVSIFIHCCKIKEWYICPCVHHSGIWSGGTDPFILKFCHGSQSRLGWVTLTSTVNWNFRTHKQWRTQEFCSGGGGFNKFSWGQRTERTGFEGGSPIVRDSGGSCNLVQEISFHIVKFS